MPLKYNPERDPEIPSSTGLWTVALVFILAVIGIGIYFNNKTPPAPPPPPPPVAKVRRLAPKGTFYVVDYLSVRIKSGIIGFEPGREVHLVKVLQDKRKLVVTDGSYEAEADPEQLTNDIDIAELARSHDAASQSQLAKFQAAEKARYEKSVEEQNEAHAKDVVNFSQGIVKGSVVGTYNNPLNKGPEATRSFVYPTGYYYGSPYSYFSSPYRVLYP